MNFFNPNVITFPTQVTNLPPVVTNLPPIVTRRVNVVNRYNIVNQPHILEDVTQVCNHVIKRHQCCTRPMCFECCDYHEEGCCGGQMVAPTFLGGQNFGGFPGMQQGVGMQPAMDFQEDFMNAPRRK